MNYRSLEPCNALFAAKVQLVGAFTATAHDRRAGPFPTQRHRLARLFLPEMPGVLSGRVFRCFKTLERLGDKITGFAGPWFVALAWILLSYGVLCFLDVVLPTLSAPVLTIPLCMLLVVNMLGNYYWACFMPPGVVGDEVARRRPWLYARKKRGDPVMRRNFAVTTARCTMCKRCRKNRPEVRVLWL